MISESIINVIKIGTGLVNDLAVRFFPNYPDLVIIILSLTLGYMLHKSELIRERVGMNTPLWLLLSSLIFIIIRGVV